MKLKFRLSNGVEVEALAQDWLVGVVMVMPKEQRKKLFELVANARRVPLVGAPANQTIILNSVQTQQAFGWQNVDKHG